MPARHIRRNLNSSLFTFTYHSVLHVTTQVQYSTHTHTHTHTHRSNTLHIHRSNTLHTHTQVQYSTHTHTQVQYSTAQRHTGPILDSTATQVQYSTHTHTQVQYSTHRYTQVQYSTAQRHRSNTLHIHTHRSNTQQHSDTGPILYTATCNTVTFSSKPQYIYTVSRKKQSKLFLRHGVHEKIHIEYNKRLVYTDDHKC